VASANLAGLTPPTSTRGTWAVRLDFLYHACLAGLLLVLGTLVVWRPLHGWLDFWAHAAVGRWIWQHGYVPYRTLFLWTADEPWVYHFWLAQLLFFGLTTLGEPHDLPWIVLAFTALLVLLPFALVWWVWWRSGRLSSWLAIPFLIALKGLALRFQTRPELFTEVALCLLYTFLIVWSARQKESGVGRQRAGLLAAILLLFVLWTNLHGGVVIGLLVLAVTAGCDLVQDRFTPRSRRLVVLSLLAPVAVCVNPYGLSYWQGLRPIGSYTFAHILEWRPIWRSPLLPEEMLIAVGVLIPLALGAWLANPQRRWAQLGWLLLLGGLFIQARRNVWPFTLTCLMVLAANAQMLDPESLWQKLSGWTRRSGQQPQPLPGLVRWPVRAGLLAWLLLECLLLSVEVRPVSALLPTRLEQGIVRFLREQELAGRMLNDYENSSYLQWCLAGQPALYIDLLNAYPDAIMRDYQDLTTLTSRGRELLDEQEIELVVLTTNRGGSPSLAALANYLDASSDWSSATVADLWVTGVQADAATPWILALRAYRLSKVAGEPSDWARVYASRDGVIWVRRTPAYQHLWGPLNPSVGKVEFSVLERWGNEDLQIVPAIKENFAPGS
jgi:hypothetical protein